MRDYESWLEKQIEDAKQRFESADNDGLAYQYAAEAETYARIRDDAVLFGGPEKAVEVYEAQIGQPDFGMTTARVRALKRYLDWRDSIEGSATGGGPDDE